MAQTTRVSNKRLNERQIYVENLAVNVAQSGLTTLAQVEDMADTVRTVFQVTAGAQALDAFEIQVKAHQNGDWLTLYSATGDFTTPAGILVGASGDLTALTATSKGWFIMETRGLYGIRVQASCANVAGTSCNVYMGAG